jgi:hypothetical protein
MKKQIIYIIILTISWLNGFSQGESHIDIGGWKINFEKGREFTVKIIYPSNNGDVNSLMEYFWDDVLLFQSIDAHRDSYITIEDSKGIELKRFPGKKKRKFLSMRIEFASLKNLLNNEVPYTIVIHNQNQELPLIIGFSLSNKKANNR